MGNLLLYLGIFFILCGFAKLIYALYLWYVQKKSGEE